MVADMEVDKVADMEANMVKGVEVDKVAEYVAGIFPMWAGNESCLQIQSVGFNDLKSHIKSKISMCNCGQIQITTSILQFDDVS